MENLNHPIQHRQQQQRQKQFRKYRSFDHGHVGVARTTSSRQSSNRETFRVTGYCSASEYNISDILDQWIGIEVERVLEEFDEGVHLILQEQTAFSTLPWPSPSQDVDNSEEDEDEDYTVNTQSNQEVFILKFGVVVFWGMTEEQEHESLRSLWRYAFEPLASDAWEMEEFKCVVRTDQAPKIFNDYVILNPLCDEKSKLALSLAIGQSVKLERFEWLVEDTLSATRHIPGSIATKGTSKMSRVDTVRVIGSLFNIRTDIYLKTQILNTPETLRTQQHHLALYTAARQYLEIPQRILILTQRLQVISDVLYLLHKHLTKARGENLFWIVIALVFTTTVIAVFEILIKLEHFFDKPFI